MYNKKINLSNFLLKHWLTNIITLFLLCILIVIYALFIADVKYTSDTSILPKSSQFSSGLSGQFSSLAGMAGIDIGGNLGAGQETYADILTSRLLINRVLDTKYEIDGQSNRLINMLDIESESAKDLRGKALKYMREEVIYIKIDTESDILNLAVTLYNPTLAAKVADTMLKNLNIIVKNRIQKEYRYKHKRIIKQIEENKNKIDGTENQLQSFLESTANISSPKSEIQELSYRRRLELLTTTYIELKKQLEIFMLNNLTNLKDIKILDRPNIPHEKSRPQRALLCISLGIVSIFIILSINFMIVIISNFKVDIQNKKFEE